MVAKKANAALIAAAPDLLEALKEICAASDEWDDDAVPEVEDSPAAIARNTRVRIQRQARLAIAAAEGS